VLPDPLPDTLADLTPDQVEAYDAAWAVCDDDLSDGWSTDSDATAALTTCLADQLDVPVDDTGLAAFVTWLTQTQDPLLPASTSPSTSPSTSGPSPTAPSPTTSPLG
jgi:hypothetical protein